MVMLSFKSEFQNLFKATFWRTNIYGLYYTYILYIQTHTIALNLEDKNWPRKQRPRLLGAGGTS